MEKWRILLDIEPCLLIYENCVEGHIDTPYSDELIELIPILMK